MYVFIYLKYLDRFIYLFNCKELFYFTFRDKF